jgi:hypothetical protein
MSRQKEVLTLIPEEKHPPTTLKKVFEKICFPVAVY